MDIGVAPEYGRGHPTTKSTERVNVVMFSDELWIAVKC